MLLIFLSIAYATAQSKWYISPSGSFTAFTDGKGVVTAALTAGYYVGQNDEIRIDLRGDCLFHDNNEKLFSVAVLVSTETPLNIFSLNRFFTDSSIGIGVLSPFSGASGAKFIDVIFPIKSGLGYRITDKISIGTELSYTINASKFKERSIFSVGINVGIRF